MAIFCKKCGKRVGLLNYVEIENGSLCKACTEKFSLGRIVKMTHAAALQR